MGVFLTLPSFPSFPRIAFFFFFSSLAILLGDKLDAFTPPVKFSFSLMDA